MTDTPRAYSLARTRHFVRNRGHGRRPSAEMAAAMFVPTAGIIALLWRGLVEDIEALQLILHVVMLPSMIVAMLLRRDEYSDADAHVAQRVTA